MVTHDYEYNALSASVVGGEESTDVSYGDYDAGQFVNIRRLPDPVPLTIKTSKSFKNGTLAGGDFTFTLTGKGQNDTEINQEKQNREDGTVVFNVLLFSKAGEYEFTVSEKTGQADGIIYDEAQKTVRVRVEYDYDTNLLSMTVNEQPVVDGTFTVDEFTNELIVSGFEFTKTDGSQPLAGASFALVSADGSSFTAISGEDGKVKFAKIPIGSYVLSETAAPSGYKASEERIDVTVNPDRTVTFTRGGEQLESIDGLMVNMPISESLVFTKTDGSDPLPGAVFKMTGASGSEYTVTSDKNGVVTFESLSVGRYFLTEESAPSGYIRFDGQVEAELRADGSFVFFVDGKEIEDLVGYVVNPPKEESFNFVKYSTEEKPLDGAKFTLTDKKGNAIEAESRAHGRVSFTGLRAGEYTLREKQAPKGYVRSSETVTVKIGAQPDKFAAVFDRNGKELNLTELERLFANEPKKINGSFSFTKYSYNKNTRLSGANFSIKLRGNGTEYVAVSDEYGFVEFTDIPEGSYTLAEVKAPKGFVVTENTVEIKVSAKGEVTFTNSDNETIDIEEVERLMENYPEQGRQGANDSKKTTEPDNGSDGNTPKDSTGTPSKSNSTVIYKSGGNSPTVKTSDSGTSAIISIALSIIALAVMAGIVVYRRRNTSSQATRWK